MSPVTVPKIVCFLFSQSLRSSVTKNWLPFVLGSLALAQATIPRRRNCSREWNSSSNGAPYTDSPPWPVPVGSPPCTMKSFTIRWNTVRS